MSKKKKAMTSEKASYVKRKGHEDARIFAELLGIGKEFKSDPKTKKDVIDSEGYSYSVKSGEKKWQIFLYSKKRFETNYFFKATKLDEIFLECINSFPDNRKTYLKNKKFYKEKLQLPMRKLCKRLRDKNLLSGFLDKSLFNNGEVNFLVIKDRNDFHIFDSREVVDILSENFDVENSKARNKNQMDAQKVIFKIQNKTYGEIEMRNDSDIHYREVKFWLDRNLTFELLKNKIKDGKTLKNGVIVYGKAYNKLCKIIKN